MFTQLFSLTDAIMKFYLAIPFFFFFFLAIPFWWIFRLLLFPLPSTMNLFENSGIHTPRQDFWVLG